MSEYEDTRFPDGFLWGSAASSHQVEGNCTKNDWWQWEQQEGFVSDGSKSGIACDHYNRFEEDFALAEELGHNAHRLSIEWSRIEPEEGQWDRAEVDHYKRVLESMHRHGLTPFVTLHHFTNPLWMSKKGAWLNPQSVDSIARYSAFIARELGELAPIWLTINEPMVVVSLGYALGIFPPREREWERTSAAARHLLMAHGRMYQAVHEATSHDPLVGAVNTVPYIVPKDPESEADRNAAQGLDQFMNEYFLAGIDTGTIGPPFGDGEEVPGLKGSWDLIGINYYTRNIVTGGGPAVRLRGEIPEGAETTMMGYEVYPEGLYKGIMRLNKYRRPVYVTENGISTLDDGQRNRHLLRHLREVHRAIRDGADVRGYLYWSLMDNFEWVLGYSQKFGMCAVEPETLKRLPRPAAYLFRDVATSNMVSAEQLQEHLT